MPIPDFQSIILPLLQFSSDGKEHSMKEAREHLANSFKLNEEEKNKLLPSGTQGIFCNRVAWAKSHLTMGGLILNTKRAHFQISERGLEILKHHLKEITVKFLKQLPEYQETSESWKKDKTETVIETEIINVQTPEEVLESSYQSIRKNLVKEILTSIKSCSPSFFERLVVELLVKMGYGGSIADAGKALGKSGDGGIDGMIKEDKLGLDAIYIQAKRWENLVPVKEIRDFTGSLLGKKAKKGIFITTSSFPKSAYEFVENIEHKIILTKRRRVIRFND